MTGFHFIVILWLAGMAEPVVDVSMMRFTETRADCEDNRALLSQLIQAGQPHPVTGDKVRHFESWCLEGVKPPEADESDT